MRKGFTLVEIMIVVAIIGLLAAIAIPSFMRARTTSQMNGCINNLRQIEAAKDQFALEHGLTNSAAITGATAADQMTSLVGVNVASGYLKQYPLCPASTTITAVARTALLSVSDYTINPVGSNAACIRVPGPKTVGGTEHVLL